METITCRNVNELLPLGIMLLREKGVEQASRYGDTLEIPGPVAVHYRQPQQRVLFDAIRDANPFFHLFESLWVLGGRQDVAFLTQFNKRMAEFSDDGLVFHAAYGYRIREQLEAVIDMLRRNPDSRRAVLQIWDWCLDLGAQSVDIPCNDLVFLKVRNGRLHISVANRSNDFIWGLAGANAVQFSMLQEYLANKIGVGIGSYHQVADSFHVYLGEQWDTLKDMSIVAHDPYDNTSGTGVCAFPLGAQSHDWDHDNKAFLDDPFGDYVYFTPFFDCIVQPMAIAWQAHKAGDTAGAIAALDLRDNDWHAAARQWLGRRLK